MSAFARPDASESTRSWTSNANSNNRSRRSSMPSGNTPMHGRRRHVRERLARRQTVAGRERQRRLARRTFTAPNGARTHVAT
jgi:hypothetical protein